VVLCACMVECVHAWSSLPSRKPSLFANTHSRARVRTHTHTHTHTHTQVLLQCLMGAVVTKWLEVLLNLAYYRTLSTTGRDYTGLLQVPALWHCVIVSLCRVWSGSPASLSVFMWRGRGGSVVRMRMCVCARARARASTRTRGTCVGLSGFGNSGNDGTACVFACKRMCTCCVGGRECGWCGR